MKWYLSARDIARVKPLAWGQYYARMADGGGTTHHMTQEEFEQNGMARWCAAFAAELMVCKCFGLTWNSELDAGQFKRREDGTECPDGGVFTQIRSVPTEDRRLIVHAEPGRDVKPDGSYVLAPGKKVGEASYDRYVSVLSNWEEHWVEFRGWAGGSEVQKPEYAPGPKPWRPAFYLPNRLLRPMDTFEDLKWEG